MLTMIIPGVVIAAYIVWMFYVYFAPSTEGCDNIGVFDELFDTYRSSEYRAYAKDITSDYGRGVKLLRYIEQYLIQTPTPPSWVQSLCDVQLPGY